MPDHVPDDGVTTWQGRDRKQAPTGGNARAAVLTQEHVLEIKRRIVAGEKHTHIARDFPCGAEQIGRIKRGQAWAGVPWPDKGEAWTSTSTT